MRAISGLSYESDSRIFFVNEVLTAGLTPQFRHSGVRGFAGLSDRAEKTLSKIDGRIEFATALRSALLVPGNCRWQIWSRIAPRGSAVAAEPGCAIACCAVAGLTGR